MFSFSNNLLAGQHDTQKDRRAPSRPTPITFPSLQPPSPSVLSPPPSWTPHPTGVSSHFLGLRKPADVNQHTLSLLNVTFQPECEFETLLSSLSNNAELHLPPKSWLDAPVDDQSSQTSADAASASATLLSNGRRMPSRKDFYIRARELYFKNNAAFSTLTRKASGGQAPLRLAHFRKFWEGLDNMAYYWDTTLDEYFLPDLEAANGPQKAVPLSSSSSPDAHSQPLKSGTDEDTATELATSREAEPRKKIKTSTIDDVSFTQSLTPNGFGIASTSTYMSPISPSRMLPARNAPSKASKADNIEAQSKPADFPDGLYRGYRIGNGAEMPDQYRIDCVRAFLEPIAWAFGVTLSQHRRPPVLTLGSIRFPVRMSSVAWRASQDRAKARQGWMDGPILGLQCRAEVNFGATNKLDSESVLDAVRELGGLLLLAQERAREGLTEKRGGEGKWWTTKARWGGGAPVNTNETRTKETSSKDNKNGPVERNRDGSKVRRRPTPIELWGTLKSSNALWDPKVGYEAIGKDKSVEWDDIFMVSSLNHHISILKLRVHPLYLQYLTEGKLPEDTPTDATWCSPKLQRTRWFDLFDIGDRTEAMRGIWGILSYLMRATDRRDEDTSMGGGS